MKCNRPRDRSLGGGSITCGKANDSGIWLPLGATSFQPPQIEEEAGI